MAAQSILGQQGSTSALHDVIVIGAGFGGLATLYHLREAGYDVIGLEAGGDVGGTWFWNRYPGARCDVESLDYSFNFSEDVQREWRWSERYATQPEIYAYLRFVADNLDLRRAVRFATRVSSAEYDIDASVWNISCRDGSLFRCRYLVMATGALSTPKLPALNGLDRFSGLILQTANWPTDHVDFSGQRVGVIGTGSSGTQVIPVIAKQADGLTVFQRTPNFSVPAQNRPLASDEIEQFRSASNALREKARRTPAGVNYPPPLGAALAAGEVARDQEFRRRWEAGGAAFLYAFEDLLTSEAANNHAASFVRSRIDEIVDDPNTADKLKPMGYPIGAKRICTDTDYYKTFNRSNVSLVDLRTDPIVELTEDGISLASRFVPLDVIVFATGFDAMTGALLNIDITTTSGVSLREEWADGPATYLGLQIAGLPNLFVLTGPGSPSVLSNMVLSIEHDAEWIRDCLLWMSSNGIETIEASYEAQTNWMVEVERAASLTLHARAASWYRGSNIEGKKQVFMPYVGGVDVYQRRCRKIAENGYTGFITHRPKASRRGEPQRAS